MYEVKVKISPTKAHGYPIFIGENILPDSGKYLRTNTNAQKVLIISNKTVYGMYGETVMKSLVDEGFEAYFLLLEDGEEYKNIKSLEAIWTRAIELKLERKDALVALGGGVVGDVTGFAAATYLRGIDFVQVPTTLLAQVDSSVGGKVAINHTLGKNLIGNFYQPKAVITDVSTLKTLPESEVKVGLAEVLKYGFIEKTCGLSALDKPFIDYLEEIIKCHPEQSEGSCPNEKLQDSSVGLLDRPQNDVLKIIKYCCELKAAVVNKDEKEAGLRAILNFGHTIGHAVEKCYGYRDVTHGQAVAIGMRGAFLIAKNKGLTGEEYYSKCINLLDSYGMNYKITSRITPDALYEAMQVDKKVLSGKIRLVLPVGESKVGIYNNISKEEIINVLNSLY